MQPDDAEAMFDYLRDEETVQALSRRTGKNSDGSHWKQYSKVIFMLDPIGKWAIVYDQKMIGTIDLRLIEVQLASGNRLCF